MFQQVEILPWIISLTLLQIPAAKSLKENKRNKALLPVFCHVTTEAKFKRLRLLGLCRKACSSKYGSFYFYVVMRVQTLAYTVVGVLPFRDDRGQTSKHPNQE